MVYRQHYRLLVHQNVQMNIAKQDKGIENKKAVGIFLNSFFVNAKAWNRQMC